jgi:peptidyl-tRNA hydrolase, PTH1 family
LLVYQTIIGLGNPGEEYSGTRHNAGFLAVDGFCRRHRGKKWHISRGYALCRLQIKSQKMEVIKPLLFMNRSGVTVKKYLAGNNVPSNTMAVIYDDLDLAPGRIKIKQGGGTGGHKGVESIIQHTGNSNFIRIRIGIGRPTGTRSATDYVLDKPDDLERDLFEQGISRAIDALEMLIYEGAIPAMNYYNQQLSGDDASAEVDNIN